MSGARPQRRPVHVGARVVVRYRRPAGAVPPLTDALGVLEQLEPELVVRTADARAIHIDPETVTVLKAVPPRPLTVRAVRAVERALARERARVADPGGDTDWAAVAGWWVRADLPAVPVATPEEDGGAFFGDVLNPDAITAVADWYSARGAAPVLRLPERVTRPPASWPLGAAEQVLAHVVPGADADAPIEVLSAPAADQIDRAVLAAQVAELSASGAGLVVLALPADADAPDADDLGAAGLWPHHRAFHVAVTEL